VPFAQFEPSNEPRYHRLFLEQTASMTALPIKAFHNRSMTVLHAARIIPSVTVLSKEPGLNTAGCAVWHISVIRGRVPI
jgi:hypothetical protein